MSSEEAQQQIPVNTELVQEITTFEPAKLRHVEKVNEKVVLPTQEDVQTEKRLSIVNTIEQFDPKQLKKTSTVEKNILPDKDTIELEKKNSQ